MKSILKVVVGIGLIGQGLWAVKHPGAPLLITDQMNGRVIEVEKGVVLGTWSFTGLGSPIEAIPLTNGNWIITDSANNRIIEVDPANKTVVKEWMGYESAGDQVNFFYPRDVRRCVWYDPLSGEGTDTLLVVDGDGDSGLDGYGIRIVEILYNQVGYSEAKMVNSSQDMRGVREAEKRLGKGNPTYLIVGNNGVREGSETGGIWQWNWVSHDNSRDAEWLPCGSILVVRGGDYNNVVEIKGGSVIATWTFSGFQNFYPHEATMIEDGNIIIAGATGTAPSNDGYILRGTRTTTGGSWTLTPKNTIYSTRTARFFDVEEKGIINIAKIVYRKQGDKKDLITLAGVVIPILQPTVIAPPYIVATKTVDPRGKPLKSGDIATYTITLKNTGRGTATDIIVIDQIPPGTEYVVDSDSPEAQEFSDNGGQTWTAQESEQITHIKWNIGTLGPGGTYTIQFRVRIK